MQAKFAAVLAATVTSLAVFGSEVQASTFFQLDDVTVDAFDEGPDGFLGLDISTKVRNLPISGVLEEGETRRFPLFKIWSDETFVNLTAGFFGPLDDVRRRDIEVNFDFAAPDVSATVNGFTRGRFFPQNGVVRFFDPIEVQFENGGLFTIDLEDTKFGLRNKKTGKVKKGTVYANVTLVSESQPVPEPASLLGLLAVGAVGAGVARKRQAA